MKSQSLPGTTSAGWQCACDPGGTSPVTVGRELLQPFPPHRVPENHSPVEGCLAHPINHTQYFTKSKSAANGSIGQPDSRTSSEQKLLGKAGEHQSRGAPHLLPLVVGLSHFDVTHQAAPCAGIQDVDNCGHEIVDIHRLGVIIWTQLGEEAAPKENV